MGVPSRDLTPTIRTLWPHHRSMARAMVAAGLTPTQLATAYGFTQGQITRIINSPVFRVELARLEGEADEVAVDVRKDLKLLAERAVEILDDQLNKQGVDVKVQQQAAFGVLDRSGYGKTDPFKGAKRISITQVNVANLSDKELRDDVLDLVEDEDWEEEGEEKGDENKGGRV